MIVVEIVGSSSIQLEELCRHEGWIINSGNHPYDNSYSIHLPLHAKVPDSLKNAVRNTPGITKALVFHNRYIIGSIL